ncbi:MAG TPA: alanine racemase [Micropepsaceae bacterium]|nr:alanine racemase [Micropepsaceae bacterium]
MGAELTVRLGALAANYGGVKRRASSALAFPVVKANAYGLGVDHVAPRLASAGADTFFVARIEEGVALRALLPNVRIFVLDGFSEATAPAFLSHRLQPVLNSPEEIAQCSDLAKRERRKLEAAVQIDTGMNRSGLSYSELAQIEPQLKRAFAGIELKLVMSHLACADEPSHPMNKAQLERFRAALARLPSAPASLAASAGIELGRDYHFDAVRPGMALYGGKPIPARANPYSTVAILTSRVLQLRRVDKGETVGYGATFAAARPTILATVAMGYADGLMRANAGKGKALLGGVRVGFAGRISMDLAALDVTDVPEAALVVGAQAEFLGDAITLDEVAESAGTITHEVLTSISPRARRRYTES